YEYVTPELLLLIMCEKTAFIRAFSNLGGSISLLSEKLESYLEEYAGKGTGSPEASIGLTMVFSMAQHSAHNSSRKSVELSHMVHAIFALRDCYAVYYMMEQDIKEADLLRELAELDEEDFGAIGVSSEDEMDEELEEETDDDAMTLEEEEFLRFYAPCLNDLAEEANPLIGREAEMERTIQILCRKDKNNPLHIGEPGVGKTALTMGLAKRLNQNDVPEALKGARIFSLDLGGVLAGTQYRGDFEKRLKKILEVLSKEEKPILYVDEIHNLAGAGAIGESSFDAANLLKPYLTKGKIRFIGATTFEEHKKHFERMKSLARRFQIVELLEPGVEESVKILEGLQKRYERFHGVKYKRGVLRYAVEMSGKYINERFLPDKAIDLIDEAGAYRKIHPIPGSKQYVDKDLIDEVLTKICRVEINAVKQDGKKALMALEKNLLAQIFGQDEAIRQVVNAVKFSKAGLIEEAKPLASLFFVGPTGVGKTEIAKTLAKELGISLIRFDMSEYAEKHSVAKLIGAPAGYVGYEDGGLLTEEIRKHPSAVLLLDEIEKAHPDIYSALLQVMDYATLTDNQGRKADFRNIIIIMTTNAGAARLGKAALGFQSGDNTSEVLLEEVKRTFSPEFRNRLSQIVMFHRMDERMAGLIAKKKLGELSALLQKKNVEFSFSKEAASLLQKKGITREYGARELDRVIQNEVKPLLAEELLFGKLAKGGKCRLLAEKEQFVFDYTR
ncbi:MAG: AAA family ATPase, partial [Lachnospiraceae bacterium]|nr:AAA family ATPase [Lachnospiraceae bacterium]